MNSVFRSVTLGLALCVAICASAIADEDPGRIVPTFESLDRNADNRLSRTEAGYNRLLSTIFVTSDVDGDGFVSRAEYGQSTSGGSSSASP
jgi:hypothetical protein